MRKQMIQVYLIITVFSVFCSNVFADEEGVGVVVKYQGTVKHFVSNSVNGHKLKQPGAVLKNNDSLLTKQNSLAYLSLVDDSKIILTERSRINFTGVTQVTYGRGKVLFSIRKQGGLKGFKITSETAVIGVKGTKFIVNGTKNKLNIYMKEGFVDVTPINGQFKRFKQKEINDFEAFKRKQLNDFDEFNEKRDLEFMEFVDSFSLKAGRALIIDGDQIVDTAVPEEINNMFDLFNNF